MKNKKGFTLIEILVALVLILSITSMAIVAYKKISVSNKEDQYNMIVNEIITAAESYISNNKYLFDNYSQKKVIMIPLNTLVINDYLKVLVNPINNKKLDKCSIVISDKGTITYDATPHNEICSLSYLIYDTVEYEDKYELMGIKYYNKENKEITPTSDKWINISTYDAQTDKDDSKNNQVYICSEIVRKDNNKELTTDSINGKVKIKINGSEQSLTFNNVIQKYCYEQEEDVDKFNYEMEFNSKTLAKIVGKDTIAPKIEPDVNNKIESGDAILSTITNKLQYRNKLKYEAEVTDNIKVDNSSFTTNIPNSNYLTLSGNKISYIPTYNPNNDVSDYLKRDPFDLKKYIFLFNTGIKDIAGNSTEITNEYLGYIPCQNSDTIHKLGSFEYETIFGTIKHEGDGLDIFLGCYGNQKLVYKDISTYDYALGIGLKGIEKSDWNDIKNGDLDKIFGYAVCNVDRTLEFNNSVACDYVVKAKNEIMCMWANKDCTNAFFKNICKIRKEIAKAFCENSNDGDINLGEMSVLINLLDKDNKKIWTKIYKSNSHNTDLNKESRYDWFNGIDFNGGLKIQVLVDGSTSYEWKLPDADTSNKEIKTDVSSTGIEKTYYITKDGENRKAYISVSNGKENININLTFDVDLTPPTIKFTNGPEKKSCGGAKGVSTSWEVTDKTSGPDIAKYYYGNETEFDSTIKVPYKSGNGSKIKHTDDWSSNCTQNRKPSPGVDYFQKIWATDIAGNIAQENSPSSSKIGK